MMKYMVMFWLAAIVCGGAAQSLPGGEASFVGAESLDPARIRSDRAQAGARYAEAERICYQKFAVSRCLEDAKLERRKTLRELSRQERLLNQQARQNKGAARLGALEKKSAENKARREQSSAETTSSQDFGQRAPSASVSRSGASRAGAGTALVRTLQRRTAEPTAVSNSSAEGVARHQKKIQQAEQRRAKRDLKQQTKTKAPAATLPVPE